MNYRSERNTDSQSEGGGLLTSKMTKTQESDRSLAGQAVLLVESSDKAGSLR